jgi:hypothetical protein
VNQWLREVQGRKVVRLQHQGARGMGIPGQRLGYADDDDFTPDDDAE